MDVQKLFIVIADISGYTKFLKLHRFSLVHAELIITDLLRTIIDVSKPPLVVNSIEGDCVLFYALSNNNIEKTPNIIIQVFNLLTAFYDRQVKLEELNLCVCDACKKIGQLQLKFILHHGNAIISKLKQFEKLTGEDIILAHRLLKNSVEKKEYILMTDTFHAISGGIPNGEVESRVENCEGLGKVKVFIHYPNIKSESPDRSYNIWQKLRNQSRFPYYHFQRIVGLKKAQKYNNLGQL